MFFQIISFKKYFYVSLSNNFFTVFVEAPLVVEALGNCPVCPPLNPALFINDQRQSSVMRGDQKVWQLPTLVNKMVKING